MGIYKRKILRENVRKPAIDQEKSKIQEKEKVNTRRKQEGKQDLDIERKKEKRSWPRKKISFKILFFI